MSTLTNYYGKEIQFQGIPLTPWGNWAYACWMLNENVPEKEVTEAMNKGPSNKSKERMDDLSKKYFGRTVSNDDLDTLSIDFMKNNWPKDEYLKWEKNNKDKYPKDCFSDDQHKFTREDIND